MAIKCSICKIRTAKRYCAPIDSAICSVCCAKNRMNTIDCNEGCKYLEGIEYQKKRDEEKQFAKLMDAVPHGQFDDIFKNKQVALTAADIEILVRDIYVSGNYQINDNMVYDAYKRIYKIHENIQPADKSELSPLAQILFELYQAKIEDWRSVLSDEKIGQIFLRMMRSIKIMTGGGIGEFGYLNYLKNNFVANRPSDTFIIEDKSGNKIIRKFDSQDS